MKELHLVQVITDDSNISAYLVCEVDDGLILSSAYNSKFGFFTVTFHVAHKTIKDLRTICLMDLATKSK